MTPEEFEREYPKLRLGDLFMLSVFVRDNTGGDLPTSVRSFTKALDSSHRRFLRVLDVFETKTKRLLVRRVAVNPDGTLGNEVRLYADAMRLDQERDNGIEGARGTRRVQGAITKAAEPWYLYGELLGQLFDKVANEDPQRATELLANAMKTLGLRLPNDTQ
ncbi:hypothetical protein [Devosia naphthalenivorans]|uniref:hypothetical protein n=1 Tax=Devosia naphthalenivorans TaxID=2082392 RepID=UPI000D36C6C9|nr:hypothetical protein [Devosia naphthalenivorans]